MEAAQAMVEQLRLAGHRRMVLLCDSEPARSKLLSTDRCQEWYLALLTQATLRPGTRVLRLGASRTLWRSSS